MTIKDKMVACIQKVTGNPNADLWTLSFNTNDLGRNTESIGFRGVSGNVRMHEGKLRTNDEVQQEANQVISYYLKHKPAEISK